VRRIWKRRDKLDSLLRANAPEPRDEFVRAVARGIGGRRARYGGRLAIAAAVTLFAIGVFGGLGGLGYAANAVSQATGIGGDKPPKGGNSNKGDQGTTSTTTGTTSTTPTTTGTTSTTKTTTTSTTPTTTTSTTKTTTTSTTPTTTTSTTPTTTTSGDNQYGGKTTICHRTSSQKNPFVLITVSNNALPAHKAHGDTLPAADGSCPGPPIP
jgi:hypothetical protein